MEAAVVHAARVEGDEVVLLTEHFPDDILV